MIYGYRVVIAEEIGLFPASLIQISTYKGWTDLGQMIKAAFKDGGPLKGDYYWQ
ncbi:MAG: hypothetical protein AB1638_04830 [Nitrospirota bacterium]